MYRVSKLTELVVKKTPVGTNLGLYEGLMCVMGGGLLESRGAVIPALYAWTQNQCDTLRIWRAVGYGAWQVNLLLKELDRQIAIESQWKARDVGGRAIVALDTIGFYRPRLQGVKTQHYNYLSETVHAAINVGIVAKIGHVNEQNLTYPIAVIRSPDQEADNSEIKLMKRLIQAAKAHLSDNDILTADSKFSPIEMLAAGVPNVVMRRAQNTTFMRCEFRVGKRSKNRQTVRPIERQGKHGTLPATPPDEQFMWDKVKIQIWRNVYLQPQKTWTADYKRINAQTTWTVYVMLDMTFPNKPWLIISNMRLTHQEVHSVVTSRWGAEQPPLVAKQLLGAHRQFVHAPEMRHRWPEFTLLAAAILTYVASTAAPFKTGFWDRAPRRTAGRLRRHLRILAPRIKPATTLRLKRSVTAHLPKGRAPSSPPVLRI